MRLLRLLLLVVLLLVMLAFALSNQQKVTIGFWPADAAAQMPLALAVLLAMLAGFLCGATVLWAEGLKHRLRARRAEQRVAALEHELRGLRAGLPPAKLPAIED